MVHDRAVRSVSFSLPDKDGDLRMQSTTLLNVREVAAKLGVSRGTIYKMLSRDARFPRPVYIMSKAPRWRVSDIDRWVDSLAEHEA